MEWNLKKNKKLLLALLLLLGGGALTTAIAVPLALNKKTKDETPEVKEYKFIEGLKDADGKIMLFNTDDELKAYVTANWESGNLISSAMTSKYEILGESFDTKDLAMAHLLSVAPIESIDVVITGTPAYDANGMLTNSWVESTGTQTVFKGGLVDGGTTNIYTGVEADAYESLVSLKEHFYYSGLVGSIEYDTMQEAEDAIHVYADVKEGLETIPSTVTPTLGAKYTNASGEDLELLDAASFTTPPATEVTTYSEGQTLQVIDNPGYIGPEQYTYTEGGSTTGPAPYGSASWVPGTGPGGVDVRTAMWDGDYIRAVNAVARVSITGDTPDKQGYQTVAGDLGWDTWDKTTDAAPAGAFTPFGDSIHPIHNEKGWDTWYYLTNDTTNDGSRIWEAVLIADKPDDATSGPGFDEVTISTPSGWHVTTDALKDVMTLEEIATKHYKSEIKTYVNADAATDLIDDEQITTVTNPAGWYLESAKSDMGTIDTSASKRDVTIDLYPKQGNVATDGTGELVDDYLLAEGYAPAGWTNNFAPGQAFATEDEAKAVTDISTISERFRWTGDYTDSTVVAEDTLEHVETAFKASFELISKVVAGDLPATGDDFDSLVADSGTVTLQKVTGIDDKVFKDEDSAKLHYQTVEEANIVKVDTTTYTADATIFGSTIKPNTDVTALIAEIVTRSETIKEDAIDDSKHGAIPVAKSIVLSANDLY